MTHISLDPYAWLKPIYAELRANPAFARLAPSSQFHELCRAATEHSARKAEAMREWHPAARLCACWRPPLRESWCHYATTCRAVEQRWTLVITAAEAARITRHVFVVTGARARGCGSENSEDDQGQRQQRLIEGH